MLNRVKNTVGKHFPSILRTEISEVASPLLTHLHQINTFVEERRHTGVELEEFVQLPFREASMLAERLNEFERTPYPLCFHQLISTFVAPTLKDLADLQELLIDESLRNDRYVELQTGITEAYRKVGLFSRHGGRLNDELGAIEGQLPPFTARLRGDLQWCLNSQVGKFFRNAHVCLGSVKEQINFSDDKQPLTT